MNLLRRFFLNNIGLKGVSLLLAFLLWYQVGGELTTQRTISIPVEFANVPSELEIANDYTRQVELDIRSERTTASVDERRLAAVLDLSMAEPGTMVIPLSARDIKNVPYGVEVVNIAPARIRLQLERTRRKIVKVEPEILGQPAPGYQISKVTVNPSEVLISGIESRVEKANVAYTEAVDVSGRRATFSKIVYLDLEDPRLSIEGVTVADVIVEIEEQRREVQLGPLPVVFNGEASARLTPKRVQIIGSVPISFQEELDAEEFQVVVSPEPPDPESTSFEVVPEVIVGEKYQQIFRLKEVRPAFVKVELNLN